jgi:hypothetical protein
MNLYRKRHSLCIDLIAGINYIFVQCQYTPVNFNGTSVRMSHLPKYHDRPRAESSRVTWCLYSVRDRLWQMTIPEWHVHIYRSNTTSYSVQKERQE